jgi:amino acid efflux transporter
MVMEKKIGWLLLSGLIIGPIMGTGIILLPPLVYQVAGVWALPAWVVMVCVSFFFAFIFSSLTILSPGDAGVANAIEKAFGKQVKLLASFYLIGAGLFGPVAVLMIAEKYSNPFTIVEPAMFALGIMPVCLFMLLRQVTSFGRIALVLSTVSAAILFIGGSVSLLFYRKIEVTAQPFDMPTFGYTLLLLFWIIVGWEVMGSFSGEVKDPKRNFLKAAVFSAVVIAVVDIVVASAVQYVDVNLLGGGVVDVSTILIPVFGGASRAVFGVLALALCINTYLAFVGGISRLAASLAESGQVAKFFGGRSRNNTPARAILFIMLVHIVLLVLLLQGVLDIEVLVAIADGFFIANAIIGILAGMVLFKSRWLKVSTLVLALFFAGILLFSAKPLLAIIMLMATYVLSCGKIERKLFSRQNG